MYRLGYQLLAGTVLAHYQYRCIGGCDTLDGVENIHKHRTTPDDERAVEMPLGRILGGCVKLEGGSHSLQQHAVIPRFGYKVKGSGMNPLDGKRYAAPCRHQYDRDLRSEYLNLSEQSQSLVARCGTREIHVKHDKL